MAKQVKLLRNLSLIALAVVITLAPAVSVTAEEIALTTITPAQDTLRVKRGVVGVIYKDIDNLPDEDIGDNNLLIQGNVGIGTPIPATKLEVQGGAIKATGGLVIQTVTSQGNEDAMTKVDGRVWLRRDINP